MRGDRRNGRLTAFGWFALAALCALAVWAAADSTRGIFLAVAPLLAVAAIWAGPTTRRQERRR